jgi:anti-anti-sigma regulatory factor
MKESSSPGLPTPHKDRLIVLPLDGEIDLNVVPDVTTALNGMIAKKPQQLVVDCPA